MLWFHSYKDESHQHHFLWNDEKMVQMLHKLQTKFLQTDNGSYNLDLQLGNWFEDGCQLSQGQWQKIALGRVYFRDASFYILDEPTTWLHFKDTEKLLKILHSLVDKWNTVLVIEHNMDVIINSDYIIDIWPEWWNRWGRLLVAWDIQTVRNCSESYTWIAINKYFNYKE